jgi:hypothetical protein
MFSSTLKCFFLYIVDILSLSHPLALNLTHYICDQPLDPMGIHLLCCTHGGERTTSHDVVRDSFVSIAKDMTFHVLQEQTHILSPPFPSHWRVDIVLSVDGIYTLTNVVIIDPTQVDMVSLTTFPMGWLQH